MNWYGDIFDHFSKLAAKPKPVSATPVIPAPEIAAPQQAQAPVQAVAQPATQSANMGFPTMGVFGGIGPTLVEAIRNRQNSKPRSLYGSPTSQWNDPQRQEFVRQLMSMFGGL